MLAKLDDGQANVIVNGLDAIDAWIEGNGEEFTDNMLDAIGEFIKERAKFPGVGVAWRVIRWGLDKLLPGGITWALRRVLQKNGLYPSDRRLQWPGGL